MDPLWRTWAQLQTVWAGMGPGRRALAVLLGVLTLGSLLTLGYYQMHIDYRPLFTNLAPEEAAKVTAVLQTKGIPYRLEAGGATLSVPADRHAAARVEVAGEGVTLASGKGFELFDESPLGMTPFVQNVNYSRALQAELSRSIGQLEPVAQARVHIVRPEATVFARDQQPTTASVVLKLKPGHALHRSTAAAIVALVSRAVERLQPENVTIVDTQGRLLSDPRASEDRMPSAQLEAGREMEAHLVAKAEDILRLHLGARRAIVRVTANVNHRRVKEREELVDPERRAVLAERVSTQKTTGGGAGPRGVAGAASNIGRSVSASAGSGAGGSQQEKTETDFAVSKTSREMENRSHLVERLTVAALVDLSGQGETASKLSLNDARDLIKQAVGFKEGRDEIKIADVKLAADPEPPAPEPDPVGKRMEQVLGWVRTGSLIVGLLLVTLLGILLTRRFLSIGKRPAEAAAAPAAAVAPAAAPEVDELQQIARNDPARLAQMLTRLLEGTA